ncbi:transposable element Tcb2 transposase [Trichonephila clavipes]|uniref:Transposable element Tcb2 transposase n=1 Tax=Trichonephila clavipes TaxID=2585209 RepID=A0A8X6SJT3_TRICX|nr:transposable element Tcb2 transposase [Trichonephila clavipes]
MSWERSCFVTGADMLKWKWTLGSPSDGLKQDFKERGFVVMSIARKFIEVIGEDIFASKMKRLEISLEEDNFFRATTSQSRVVGTSESKRCHLHEDQAQGPSTDQSSRRQPHRKKCTRIANCFISLHPGTGSSFIRDPVSSIQMSLPEGHLGSRHPLRVLPMTPTHRRLRLEWCHTRGNWTAVEWNQVVFSDESRFNLSSDDNRVRVWRPRGKCFNSTFALQRNITPTAGVMV